MNVMRFLFKLVAKIEMAITLPFAALLNTDIVLSKGQLC